MPFTLIKLLVGALTDGGDPDVGLQLTRPCIYKITNKKNGKIYVGSASRGLAQRRSMHLYHLRRGTHHSPILQQSFNKHGERAFVFGIIEYVDNQNNIIKREQYWIDTLKPYYNIAKKAGETRKTYRRRKTRATIKRLIFG